jgi:WD40 repeat protein
VRLWDAQAGHSIATLEGHISGVISVVFSPDGSQIVSCSVDNTVRLWDVQTRQGIATLDSHTGATRSVVFLPDGQILYADYGSLYPQSSWIISGNTSF